LRPVSVALSVELKSVYEDFYEGIAGQVSDLSDLTPQVWIIVAEIKAGVDDLFGQAISAPV
jgi:hypothetical protein